MKRNIRGSLARLAGTFILVGISLFGYLKISTPDVFAMIDDVTTSMVSTIKEPVVVGAPIIVEPVVEEVQPVYHSEVITNNTPVSVITGNRIEVAGVTRNLMKDENGEHFYLNHNIYGEYDGVGVPYMDFRHDFTGRKTIIYSHSIMGGNGPFQPLQNYHNNPSFYWNHPTITIYYDDQVYHYQIFSVYISTADSEESEGLEYFHRMDYSDSEWNSRIQQYKNYSEYDTGVSVDGNDKILILQTCSMDPNYYSRYYRYNLLIMAKLI